MKIQLDIFGNSAIELNPPSRFYNTIGLTNHALSKARKQNGRQNQAVLDFFKANSGKKFTALQVNDRLHFHESSTRRALTDLAKTGQIEMTGEKIMERYGKMNHLFTYKS